MNESLKENNGLRSFQLLPAPERFLFIYNCDICNRVSINQLTAFHIEQRIEEDSLIYETRYVNELGTVLYSEDGDYLSSIRILCMPGESIEPSELEWAIHCCNVGRQNYRDLLRFRALGGCIVPPPSDTIKVVVSNDRGQYILSPDDEYWSLGCDLSIVDLDVSDFERRIMHYWCYPSHGVSDMDLERLYFLFRFLEELTDTKLKVEFIPEDDTVSKEVIDALTFVANYQKKES